MEVKLLELKELENEKVPNNQFYYLMLVPGDSEKRAKCLKVMKNIGKHNFYYCNPAFPTHIFKIQPVVRGEKYEISIQITLDNNEMIM